MLTERIAESLGVFLVTATFLLRITVDFDQQSAPMKAHIPDADFQIILSAEQMLKRPNSDVQRFFLVPWESLAPVEMHHISICHLENTHF